MLVFSQRTLAIDREGDEKASLRLCTYPPFTLAGSVQVQWYSVQGSTPQPNVKVHTLNGKEKAQIVYISAKNWWVGNIRPQKLQIGK